MLLFELVKWGIGLYLGNFGAYQKIYGPLAFVPIFLLWIYLGWVSILLGASFASSMSAFRYQPVAMRLPEGYEIYGLLRMLGRFAEQRHKGKGLHSEEIQRLEPMLTDALVQEMLGELCEIGLVSRAESGEWLLARDLDDLTHGRTVRSLPAAHPDRRSAPAVSRRCTRHRRTGRARPAAPAAARPAQAPRLHRLR